MDDVLKGIDPIKREPIATQVARRLVEYILAGSIEPGGRMPSERQLAEAFGVGRSIMREALKSLSLIGLIDVRPGDGTYLRHADETLLPQIIEWGLLMGEQRALDLVEARQHIEVSIARLAAQRRTDADLEELERLLGVMESAGVNYPRFVEADVAFHVKLAKTTGNTALRDIHASIQSLLHAWIGRVVIAAGTTSPSFEEHLPIFAAIRDGDAAAAERAMEAHMAAAAERLRGALQAERDVREERTSTLTEPATLGGGA